MPENDEIAIESLAAEIQSLIGQKEEIIKQYGLKYKEIDAEYKELVAKRDEVFKEIKSAENAKIEAKRIVDAAEFKANQILSSANNEKEKTEKAIGEIAQKIILDAKILMSQAEGVMVDAREFKSSAQTDAIKASNNLAEARVVRDNADKIFVAASQKEKNADLLITANSDFKKKLDAQSSRLDSREDSLNIREEYLKNKERELDGKTSSVTEQLRILQKQQYDCSDIEKKYSIMISEFEEQKQPLLDALKKQSEDNMWRSRELDLGFEKLKNDNQVLKSEQSKIKAIQKEILNKGE
jgi:hypothetical protein